MNAAWAVVIGAAIGFLGSVAGSLLAPLVQTGVERKRARDDRAEAEDQRRIAALGPLLTEWAEAALAVTVDIVKGEPWSLEIGNRLNAAAYGILLEFRRDEEDLVTALTGVMARLTYGAKSTREVQPRSLLASGTVNALAAWRRGSVDATAAAKMILAESTMFDHAVKGH